MATSYKSDGDSTAAAREHPPHLQVAVRPDGEPRRIALATVGASDGERLAETSSLRAAQVWHTLPLLVVGSLNGYKRGS